DDRHEAARSELGAGDERDRRERDRRDDESHRGELERWRARDSELARDPSAAPRQGDRKRGEWRNQGTRHPGTIRGTLRRYSAFSSPASRASPAAISPSISSQAVTRSTVSRMRIRRSQILTRSKVE